VPVIRESNFLLKLIFTQIPSTRSQEMKIAPCRFELQSQAPEARILNQAILWGCKKSIILYDIIIFQVRKVVSRIGSQNCQLRNRHFRYETKSHYVRAPAKIHIYNCPEELSFTHETKFSVVHPCFSFISANFIQSP
jgi:hypothetical protein